MHAQLPAIQALATHYLNERSCKDLLFYNKDLINRCLILLEIAKNKEASSVNRVNRSIHRAEIERVQWLLREYLVVRLEKIRGSFYHSLDRLSEQELAYYTSYREIYREEDVLVPQEELPKRFQSPEQRTNYSGIFFLADAPGVTIDGEVHTFYRGDFIVADAMELSELLNQQSILLV
ncbi:GINS complex subunit 4 [Nematocida sp. LUAm3]|nr:GINS complex subunit 4 [Nematocida sp. LUAm3]KAI5173644.1 GINS complex subunit 4 [Nematocida sp. LUAm2]KAI5176865.1 GINS complex subunit 4 [Nematocida sp. LUAm1]